MLHASLHDPGTYERLLLHPTWHIAIRWLISMPEGIPLGIYEILGRDMYAWVQEYDTVPNTEARFECHRLHVDLQYTIEGAEAIDWIPVSRMSLDGPFSEEEDVGFFHAPSGPVTTLINSTGHLAVFFPSDAHRPKVRVERIPKVRKLVIKTHIKLLS